MRLRSVLSQWHFCFLVMKDTVDQAKQKCLYPACPPSETDGGHISAPAQSLHHGHSPMLPRQHGPVHVARPGSSISSHSVYTQSQQHNLHYRQSYSSFLIRVQHIFSVFVERCSRFQTCCK